MSQEKLIDLLNEKARFIAQSQIMASKALNMMTPQQLEELEQ